MAPQACDRIASFVYLVVMLMSLAISADSQTTNTASYLLTGLKIGSINSVRNTIFFYSSLNNSHGLCLISGQQVGITGTLATPDRFKLRFEAVSALLSLYDLQEKINSDIELTALEGSGSVMLPEVTDEDNSALTDMQVLLENVIQDSCTFVSH